MHYFKNINNFLNNLIKNHLNYITQLEILLINMCKILFNFNNHTDLTIKKVRIILFK